MWQLKEKNWQRILIGRCVSATTRAYIISVTGKDVTEFYYECRGEGAEWEKCGEFPRYLGYVKQLWIFNETADTRVEGEASCLFRLSLIPTKKNFVPDTLTSNASIKSGTEPGTGYSCPFLRRMPPAIVHEIPKSVGNVIARRLQLRPVHAVHPASFLPFVKQNKLLRMPGLDVSSSRFHLSTRSRSVTWFFGWTSVT